ncbi:helix-turn-helix domain-containing protein [Fibrella forsythiae]|uniref:Helix-turn-helix transcriptional regulator n=1 Tax=Fibrella forsythiae TaxID=2817061 RepID=A0ABS3JCA0_9BACT|nr:helix-turn-helix transcriptional regulator [Fibrella forsythiae]MBO0947613.1 helix-turn-helix transcriptional regulator [Fibrella forsythiae]
MKAYWLLLWLLFQLAGFSSSAQVRSHPVPTYQFIITELPVNTPHDAQLFLSGNFNKWNSAHPSFRFNRMIDGSYQLTVRTDLPRLEFKVTRGTWESVEGQENGNARPNHILFRSASKSPVEVDIAIRSWEDLSGTFHFYSIYDLLMLFSAFQGVLLLIAIPSIQNYNRSANRWLVLLLGLTSLLVFVRTVAAYRDVAQAYTKLLLVPDLILFLYAPTFYIYLRKLLFNSSRPASGWWRHFMPSLIQVVVYMPYLLSDNKLLQLKIVNRDPWLSGLFMVAGLVGLVYNFGYWLLCRRAVKTYQDNHEMSLSTEPQVHYLNTVLTIQAICLGLWCFFFGLVAVGLYTDTDVLSIAQKNVDLIWLTFSAIIYLLGYYAIHQPELFKLPDTEHLPLLETAPPADVQIIASLHAQPSATALQTERLEPAKEVAPAMVVAPTPTESTESVIALRQQLDTYMKRQKPYTNPNLTLAELAIRLRIQPHVLSKLINEEYQKNFFDFINYHRIEELKQRLNDPQFRSYTVLSMAYEVGFNSKTAFNRSFKKLTSQTPSQYLSVHPTAVELIE